MKKNDSSKKNDSLEKLDSLEKIELLKKELDFIELEDRLEMVQLASLDADEKRCNGQCNDVPKSVSNDQG